MEKREVCRQVMERFFGPATAKMCDEWDDSIIVDRCRQRIQAFLGDDAAHEFDSILREAGG